MTDALERVKAALAEARRLPEEQDAVRWVATNPLMGGKSIKDADLRALVSELEGLRAAGTPPILDAINWLMGCAGDFNPPENGKPTYWWRSDFAARAGLVYNDYTWKYEFRASSLPTSTGSEPTDTERLDWILRNAMLAVVNDGDTLGLFLGADEEEKAFAIVGEATGDEPDEPFTAEDVPFLSQIERDTINGRTTPPYHDVRNLETLRAALDAARLPAPPSTTAGNEL